MIGHDVEDVFIDVIDSEDPEAGLEDDSVDLDDVQGDLEYAEHTTTEDHELPPKDWFTSPRPNINIGDHHSYQKPPKAVADQNIARFRAKICRGIAFLKAKVDAAFYPIDTKQLGLSQSFIPLLRVYSQIEPLVDWLLSPLSSEAYETFGRENLSVEDLIALPAADWNQLLMLGDHLKIIEHPKTIRKARVYTSSGTGLAKIHHRYPGLAGRFDTYFSYMAGYSTRGEGRAVHVQGICLYLVQWYICGLSLSPVVRGAKALSSS